MGYYKNYNLFIEGEQWQTVKDYEGVYEVSNLGRVKRLKGKYALKDRILKYGIAKGHCHVTLSLNAIHFRISVHRLVALHFIENPENYPQVLHEDDNPFNNAVSNLRWGTQKQNIQDCHKRGRASNNLPIPKKGIENPMFGTKQPFYRKQQVSVTKRVFDDSIINNAISEVALSKDSIRSIAKKYKISHGYLSRLVNNKASRIKYM